MRVYDFDMGYERAIWRFKEQEKAGLITVMTCPTPIDVRVQKNSPLRGYRELWSRFLEDYLKNLEDPNIKTVCIDTATQCWQICHMAYLQELQENQMPLQPGQKLRERLMPPEYTMPNSRMRSIEQAGKSYGKNLVLCHYQTAVYEPKLVNNNMEDVDTGKKQLDGFKQTANLSDIVVRTTIDVVTPDPTKPSIVVRTPKCKVEVCGLTLNMIGVEFVEPTYDKLMEGVTRLRV